MTNQGTFEVDDPRPGAKDAPYTFYLPDEHRLSLLEPGDLVQLVIRPVPANRKYGAERLWVEVLTANGDRMSGALRTQPLDMPQLKPDDIISFCRWHVVDFEFASEDRDAYLPAPPSRQRWDRCLVDKEVLDGKARVGFIYREEPDMTRDGDKYPDSGWRIRADVTQINGEELENPSPRYVALGAVLNKDDSWVHLIDEPVGARYFRNPETGLFEVD